MITSAYRPSLTLTKRKNYVWVYLNSDRKFTDTIPVGTTLVYVKDSKGNAKSVTFNGSNRNLINRNLIELECIAISTLYNRKPQWIMLHTVNEYQGDIPAEALEAAKKDKNGNPKFVTIKGADGTEIQLECITLAALRRRKERLTSTDKTDKNSNPSIAYTNGGTPQSPLVVLNEYLNHLPEDSASPNPAPLISEICHDEAQCSSSGPVPMMSDTVCHDEAQCSPPNNTEKLVRDYQDSDLVWVYQDSNTVYSGVIPDVENWEGCLRDDSGHLVSILIEEEEDLIWLEQITIYALTERLKSAGLYQCTGYMNSSKRSRALFDCDFQNSFNDREQLASSDCDSEDSFNSSEPPLKRFRL